MGTRAITFYFDKTKGLSNVAVNKRFNKTDSRMKSAIFAKMLRWVEGQFEQSVSSLIKRVEHGEKLQPLALIGDAASPVAKRTVGRPKGYSPKLKRAFNAAMESVSTMKRTVGRPKGYSPKTGYAMGAIKDSTIVKRGVGRPKGYSPKLGRVATPDDLKVAAAPAAIVKRGVGRPKGYSPKTGYAMGAIKNSKIAKRGVGRPKGYSPKKAASAINPADIMSALNQGMETIANKIVKTVKNGMVQPAALSPAVAANGATV